MKLAPMAAVFLLGSPAAADAPDGSEQEFLWQVNLARSDPGAWAAENGLGTLLDAFAPKPPLAWSPTLVDSAQAKAQEFIDHGYFAHASPVTGSPNNLIINVFGYPLAGGSPFFYFGPGCDFGCSYAPSSPNSAVESLASSFAVDGGLTSTPIGAVRGLLGEICDTNGTPNTCVTDSHRRHLLAAATLPGPMIESGAGHTIETEGALTIHYWAFHTGFPASSPTTMPQFLTGVVYSDADRDRAWCRSRGRQPRGRLHLRHAARNRRLRARGRRNRQRRRGDRRSTPRRATEKSRAVRLRSATCPTSRSRSRARTSA